MILYSTFAGMESIVLVSRSVYVRRIGLDHARIISSPTVERTKLLKISSTRYFQRRPTISRTTRTLEYY